MAPILYHLSASPPVRSVLMTAKAIGLELELRDLNLLTEEHMKPEFLKINPQHTIPTLDDDGFIIWDSHAICTYLVSKYAKDDSLYPKDLKKRAVVDQRLHFDSGILFPRLRGLTFPIIFLGCKTIPADKKEDIIQTFEFLESFLTHDWLAGDHVTLADLCMLSGFSSLVEAYDMYDSQKYPKLTAWYKRCQKLPYYNVNAEGVKAFAGLVKSKLNA